jgi:hypothetical protein
MFVPILNAIQIMALDMRLLFAFVYKHLWVLHELEFSVTLCTTTSEVRACPCSPLSPPHPWPQAVPIWVTAVTVPLISVLLHIGSGTFKELAHNYLSHFGEPNVLLMLGGLTLGRALQKLQIDRLLAAKVLSRAGSNPLHFIV